jgi:hypothetical protein
MVKLVSMFVCGVQKGGTTSLHAHLARHPELSPPLEKELHFFDSDATSWDAPDYRQLHAAFPAKDGERMRFETTPSYGFFPAPLERIRVYNPDAKLIFIFRDPFERAFSNWCMQRERKADKMSFAEAIRKEEERLSKHKPMSARRRKISYVSRGRYGEQVRHALALFPKEQMLFLKSEDFSADHEPTLAAIASFLGIKPFPIAKEIRIHTRKKIDVQEEPTDDDRLYVANILRDDMLEFSRLTGLDISGWSTVLHLAEAA